MNRKIEKEAIEILENPMTYPSLQHIKSYKPTFRIWSYPAFNNYKSWFLFEEKEEYRVRQITWIRDKSRNLSTPCTVGAEAVLNSKMVQNFIFELEELKISPFDFPKIIGLDGTFYGIEYGDFYYKTKLSWWSTIPEKWHPLEDWFEQIVECFETALP